MASVGLSIGVEVKSEGIDKKDDEEAISKFEAH